MISFASPFTIFQPFPDYLIQPFPDYLKINKKKILEERINEGIRKIEFHLNRLDNIEGLIFKTQIEKSLGNISLLIKERISEDKDLFQKLRNLTTSYSFDRRAYFKIIIATACAINGYIDEMKYYISQEEIKENYPVISRILNLLYLYYSANFEQFNVANMELSRLVPESILPLLFNLHYQRFKIGKTVFTRIYNLFKSVWRIDNSRLNIHSNEKKIFNFLRNNLTWYPFTWAVDYESYVKSQQTEHINLLIDKVVVRIEMLLLFLD